MTPRERVLAAINHQPLDRLPTDIWATKEVMERLCAYFEIDTHVELLDQLQIDGMPGIAPPYIGPKPKVDGEYYENEWGMGFLPQSYETGVYDEQVHYPLAEAETIEDLEAFPWPSPDWYDYSDLVKQAAKYPDRAIQSGYHAIFYYHNLLRGLELSLMDPILKPDFTRYLIARLSELFNEYHRRCFEAAGHLIDASQVTDDYGSQHSLLISPRTFNDFYRDSVQQAIDLVRAYDITVFHHDDGDMRPLLPTLVDMGIGILNPIQWRCGNWDLDALKSDYGHRICFHGGVDNQHTLPFGTVDEVVNEVRWLKGTLGRDGTGFIIAPCHNIQANTSTEKIIAMYETAIE